MKSKIICLLLFILTINPVVYGQRDMNFRTHIEEALWNYVYNSRKEKCYLHIDKESCLPGDSIYFRGYLFNGSFNNRVDYSRFIYIELVDRANVVYNREKVACDSNLVFQGYLPISENVSQGEFFIRAYTYWMQGEKEEYIYRKRVRIVSPYDHRIRCKMDVEQGSNGRRILKLEFLNRQGERYENIEFHYKIPGETPDTSYLTANTGYSGQQRIVVEDSLSDHIWLALSNNCEWDYEGYIAIPGSSRDYNLTFYPEGGSYIADCPQRIGVKSVGRDGIGVAVSGSIYDETDSFITSFSTNAMGIGSFEIRALPEMQYRVVTKSSEIKIKEFLLPKFKQDAVSLRIDAVGDNLVYKLLCDSLNQTYRDGCIVIHSRGVPLAILDIATSEGKIMNLGGAPAGVVEFVLLDGVGEVLSKRLWFHNPIIHPQVDIFLPSGLADRRAMQDVSIRFANNSNINDSLIFSISVINNGQTYHDNRNGGLPVYLLLDSDIEEFIENPSYYFASSTRNRHIELDNLMITNSWKRFDISDILTRTYEIEHDYYVERGQFLSGEVRNFMGKPVTNAKILIIGSNGVVCESKTDSEGRFIENDIWYDEDTRFYVQALSKKGKDNVEMLLDDPDFRSFSCVEPVGSYLYYGDEDFYKNYGKDYIFADNGVRIQTLGIVRVGAMSREKQQEQLLDEWQQLDMRMAFVRGFTNVERYGQLWWSDLSGARGYRGYEALKDWLIYGKNPGDILGPINSYSYEGKITDIPGIPDEYVRRWNAIEKNTKLSSGERASTLVYRGDYNGIEVFNGYYDMAEGTVTPYLEMNPIMADYQFNIQTVVPFAPQVHHDYMQPSYNVPTDLLKDPIDEKITRYWNPNAVLSNGDSLTFSFPTAAGYRNTSYTIIVEGYTTSGVPIYETYIINI
ncbi:MAG: hypothetical protein E7071_08600 [Bacteroidales bacterium]|nr:hypothetical protein [Bacteroidales bacterium]